MWKKNKNYSRFSGPKFTLFRNYLILQSLHNKMTNKFYWKKKYIYWFWRPLVCCCYFIIFIVMFHFINSKKRKRQCRIWCNFCLGGVGNFWVRSIFTELCKMVIHISAYTQPTHVIFGTVKDTYNIYYWTKNVVKFVGCV